MTSQNLSGVTQCPTSASTSGLYRWWNNGSNDLKWCHIGSSRTKTRDIFVSGTIPKWSEGLVVRESNTRAFQDSWRIYPGKRVPNWCETLKMDRSQCVIQHDRNLPYNLLTHDKDQRGCYPLDQRFDSQEKDATEEWNSKYHRCTWRSHPVSLIEDLRRKSSHWNG